MNHDWFDIIPEIAIAKIAIGIGNKIMASTSLNTAEVEVAEKTAELEKKEIETQTLVQQIETLQKESASLVRPDLLTRFAPTNAESERNH